MNERENVDRLDGREPWSGLELEEPSNVADAAVLTGARRHQRTLRRHPSHAGRVARRAVGFAGAVLAAATVITVTLWWPSETTPSFYALAAAEDLSTAVRQLRVDVGQIGEMSELIADDRAPQRDEIMERLAACQARLKALERAIAADDWADDSVDGGTDDTLDYEHDDGNEGA